MRTATGGTEQRVSRLANAAAVATTLTLLTVRLRNAGAEQRAIKDEEEAEMDALCYRR